MKRVITFDLGETLVHYEGIPLNWSVHYSNALTKAFDTADIVWDQGLMERCCGILSKYNTRVNPREAEVSSEIIFKECGFGKEQISNLNEGFFSYFQRSCKPYPEAVKTLKMLKDKGFKLAVLTDVPYGMPKDFVLRDLIAAEIQNQIDLVLTSVETGYRKPNPKTFKHLAKSLETEPENLIYVGNEKKDIDGINSVGGFSVLIDRDNKAGSWGEAKRIRSLEELAGIF